MKCGLYNGAFYQGLHCLHRQYLSPEKEIHFFLKSITCDPIVDIMEYHNLTI